MRPALIWLFVLLASGARGADALILIDSQTAGPHVNLRHYVHPTWVRWPPAVDSGANRLLSLPSGQDWRSGAEALSLVEAEPLRFEGKHLGHLRDIGFFRARREVVRNRATFAVAPPSGMVSPATVLMALGTERSATVLRWEDSWPDDSVWFAMAKSWDDVKAVSERTKGRTLVVEYPPAAGSEWSRLWLYGRGWHRGRLPTDPKEGTPGVLDAKQILSLLLWPGEFHSKADTSLRWGGGNRWFEHVRGVGPAVLGVLTLLATGVLLLAVARVSIERSSRTLAWLIGLLWISPAAVVLAGNLAYWLGLQGWPVWLAGSWLLLSALVAGIRAIDARPLAAEAWVSLPVLLLLDPRWSWLSQSFGWKRALVSEDAMAAVAVSLCLLCAYNKPFVRGLLCAIALLTMWACSGDRYNVYLLAPLLCGLAAARRLRARYLIVGVVVSVAWLVARGITWTPGGLLQHLDQRHMVDFSRQVQILLSPAVFTSLVLVGFVLLFGDRFLWHQLQTRFRADPTKRPLFLLSVACAGLGIALPEMLHLAWAAALGGLAAILHDALDPV